MVATDRSGVPAPARSVTQAPQSSSCTAGSAPERGISGLEAEDDRVRPAGVIVFDVCDSGSLLLLAKKIDQ